jgi:PAS domain S-box-containing protein
MKTRSHPPNIASALTNQSRPPDDTHFHRIVEGVPGCIWVADATGQIVYANKMALATLGRPLQDLFGQGWFNSLDSSCLADAHALWTHSICTRQPLNATWKFRQHDGVYRWLQIKAEATTDDELKFAWYVLGVDVDEQIETQKALKASEQEAREILDRVPAMISIRTEDGLAYTNKRLSEYVGATITDLRDGAYLNYTHPDDREAIEKTHVKSPHKAPNEIIYRLRGKDGVYRWFHTRADPYFNEDGSVYRWYALNSDIDDLYRSRELLREREFQLNLLTETLPALLWKAEPDGALMYVNRKATEYTGRTFQEFRLNGWVDLVHPDDLEETQRLWRQLLGASDGYHQVHRILGADGRYTWFHTSVAAVRDENGKTVAFHAVMLDATAQKNAEIALQQSERKMQRMMDTIPSLLWSASPDGEPAYISRRGRDYSGMSLEQFLRLGWRKFIHPDDFDETYKAFFTSIQNGQPYHVIHRLRRADGAYRWHDVRGEPLKDHEGNIIQWYGLSVDIDEQRRAEDHLRELRAELARAWRAATVAELSASIAHELNQPLTSVMANAQAARRWLSTSPSNIFEAVASIERVVRDGRAADAAMRSIRALFERQPFVRAPLNMVELVREAIGLSKENATRRSTPIEWHFEEPILTVLVDRLQIHQVIINLVKNAAEAMQAAETPRMLRIYVRRTTEGLVLTEFIDNGPGISGADPDKVFDAFFTTKANGMGIGLAISRSIVEAHDGRLWAENNPGGGAKFSLLLRTPENYPRE